MEVPDPHLHAGGVEAFAGCVSIEGAQTELLHRVGHLGHVARVGVPSNPFIRLSLQQRHKGWDGNADGDRQVRFQQVSDLASR